MIPIGRLIFAVFFVSAFSLWAAECAPGEKAEAPPLTSPDGRYRLLNLLCSNQGDERGALVLLEVKSGIRRTLYPYGRNASALWSPDSRHIAINDYAGSDFTNNLVFSTNQNTRPIDLSNQLLQSGQTRDIPKDDHLYISAIKWRSGNDIELIAWGHGGVPSKGFCQCYVVSLDGKTQRCVLHATGSDLEQYCLSIKK